MALIGEMHYLTIGGKTYSLPSSGGEGTVTSVSVSNATNGGLTVSGSPITTSGTINIGHSNVLTSAQTTQAVYPIKIDKNGHISGYGTAVAIPTNVSDLTNDAGYLTSYTETDPTVPSWAKASTKPTYTYSEVGAASSSHTHGNITNGGDITATAPTIATGDQIIINDNSESKVTNGPTFDGSTTTKALTPKGTWESFLQSYTETDPTVPSWAKQSSKPTYTASEVGALPANTTIPTITLNGSSTTSPSFYAPTGAGTSGQYLKSNGTGAPTWASFPTIPSITLNGSNSTSPSFYAPTSAGTSGYYLKSNGSGAPTWAVFPTIPTIPSNNVTGSGTSGQLALWSGTNTLTDGPKVTISTSTPSGGTNGDIWFVYS